MVLQEVRIHKVEMTPPIIEIKDCLAKFMEVGPRRFSSVLFDLCLTQPYLKKAREAQLVFNYDPVTLHPFSCQTARQKLQVSGQGRQLPWAFNCLKVLEKTARIMGTLVSHAFILQKLDEADKY